MNEAGAVIQQISVDHSVEGFLKLEAARQMLSVSPKEMKSKSEKDCPFCMVEKAAGNQRVESCTHLLIPWRLRKGRGGRKKRISTQGYACPNPSCDYYRIIDEQIHALVGYGNHGKGENIQDFFYQCCKRKSSARRNTGLYCETISLSLSITGLVGITEAYRGRFWSWEPSRIRQITTPIDTFIPLWFHDRLSRQM